MPKILTDWDSSLNEQLKLPFDKTDPKIRMLIDYGGLQVWLVEGKSVREQHEIDFTEGGNPSKYKFIPFNEIWLDDWLAAPDQAPELFPTLLHELIEYKLMGKDGMKYNDAHKEASTVELKARVNPVNIKREVDSAAKKAIAALNLNEPSSKKRRK